MQDPWRVRTPKRLGPALPLNCARNGGTVSATSSNLHYFWQEIGWHLRRVRVAYSGEVRGEVPRRGAGEVPPDFQQRPSRSSVPDSRERSGWHLSSDPQR